MTNLSARQYQLALTLLGEAKRGVSIESAGQLNQITFNSFARRGYIKPVHNGFIVTKELQSAADEFHTADIYRKLSSVKLGRWASEMLDNYERQRQRRANRAQVA